MTSFSSSSTAHPTERLPCSAHTSELWPPAFASVIHQCPPPHPRGPPRTHRNLSTMLESMLPPRALVLPWSWSSAVEGRERAWMYDSLTAGSRGSLGLCSATFEGPWSLEAPWCLWEEPGRPPAGRLSPLSIWDSASCQNRGGIPSTAPWLHAHQPHLPEVKGLHCLHPPCLAPHLLPWPV